MTPGVLLLAYGGPAAPGDVRPFVEAVLRGRPGIAARIDEIARRYEAIGGISPLPAATAAQAQGLALELASRGRAVPVFVGMRFGRPSIAEALAAAHAQGIDRLSALVLAPHRSHASREAYQEAVEQARRDAPASGPAVRWAASWFDHEGFISALADRVREAVQREPAAGDAGAAWLLTAHSLPAAAPGVATYAGDLRATACSLAARFGDHAWRAAYQSRSAKGDEPWLGPDISTAIRDAAAARAPAVLAVPAGFVADNLEVRWDLDMEAARVVAEAGLAFARAGTVGTHPGFLRALADAALPGLEESA
ncbi:MAG: ferrochelatase [Candidatus Coatesbacteria bacterium]